MNIIQVIKDVSNIKIYETSKIQEIIQKAKTKLKHTILIEAILIIICIVAIAIFTGALTLYNETKDKMVTTFGKDFFDTRVLVETEIKTANIEFYENNLIKTDLGLVQTNKDIKSSVVIVYYDLDGKLQLIDSINKSNEFNTNTYEYVSKEYDNINNYTVLKSEYDRLYYKDFLKQNEKLEALNTDKDIKFIFMMILIIINAIGILIVTILFINIYKVEKEHYLPELTLSGSQEEKHYNSIEKQGIGSTNTATEGYERDDEDAIFNESGNFTGRKNKE